MERMECTVRIALRAWSWSGAGAFGSRERKVYKVKAAW